MTDLPKLRGQIDALDSKLLQLLTHRQKLAVQIAIAKQKTGAPILQTAREAEVLTRLQTEAVQLALPPTFVTAIFKKIFAASRAAQRAVKRK